MPRLSVVIPAYNAEAAIGRDLAAIRKSLDAAGADWEVVVVDDGSSDGTGRAAEAAGARVIRHPYNRGPGAAMKTGIRAVGGELVAMVDADNTYPAGDFPRFLAHAGEYDMVVGARTSEQGTLKWLRWPVKAFLRRLASYVTGSRIPDLNSGMRLFSREHALRFFSLLPDGHSFVSTITMAFLSRGLTVKYVPIDYFPRTGRSTFHPIRDTRNTLLLIMRTVMYFRPLRVFLPLGGLLLVLGAARTVWDATVIHRIKESDIMIVMTALILLSMGFLADLIVRTRPEG